MHTRIAQAISDLGLKKVAFAKKLGLSQPFVSELCSGKSKPSDRTISDICREFGVDEVWLRTGVGEPFPPRSRRDVIDDYLGELSEGKRSDVEQLLIEFMAETPVEEWEVLNGMLKRLAGKVNGED